MPERPRIAPAIIVHGGAASWPAPDDPAAATPQLADDRRREAVQGCRRAAEVGATVLGAGGTALDAVEAAVRALEEDERFNAGYGAVLTREGTVEHDALIIDGALRAGAVGALAGFAHPISVARRVLERGEHVLLVADGARRFALEEGLAAVPPEALISPRARARFETARAGTPAHASDTVGACAIDATGQVAAATSTGGLMGKRPGRVGDSPIPGAGGFADDRLGAVSATGHGESILRVGLCRTVAERLRSGDRPEAACHFALAELAERTHAAAGVILVDARGRIAHATNAPYMPWAAIVDQLASEGIEP
jgi:beta-aspartyl-peptidase (threonine type)